MNRIPHLRDIASAVPRSSADTAPRLRRRADRRRRRNGRGPDRRGQPIGSIWIVLILALAAAVAERGSVRFTDTTELSISPVLMLFAAVLFGPLAGGLVGAASELGDSELLDRGSPGRSPRLKWLTYTSSRFLVGAATGGVAMAMLSVWPDGSWRDDPRNARRARSPESRLTCVFAMVTSRLRGNKTSFSARTLAPLLATAVASTRPSLPC